MRFMRLSSLNINLTDAHRITKIYDCFSDTCFTHVPVLGWLLEKSFGLLTLSDVGVPSDQMLIDV